MKQHKYTITVEHTADTRGNPVDRPNLEFQVGNHDDIFEIVDKLRNRKDLSSDSATALAVGLKLFSEVMLENKELALFSEFKPSFMEFMKTLKKGTQ